MTPAFAAGVFASGAYPRALPAAWLRRVLANTCRPRFSLSEVPANICCWDNRKAVVDPLRKFDGR